MSAQNLWKIQHGVLQAYLGQETDLVLPQGIHQVGYSAFRNNQALQRVVIPEGVTKLAGLAFAGCSQLAEVVLPDGLEEIGYSAFEGCSSLTRVQLPQGLILLDRMAFFHCTGLAEIQFPDTLSVVGRDALADTAWMNSQPEGVIYAGRLALFPQGTVIRAEIRPGTEKLCVDAFRNCTTLEVVTLPDSLLEVEDRAFQGCRKLREIHIPARVQSIGYRAFHECRRLQIQLDCPQVTFGRDCFGEDATVRMTDGDPAALPSQVRDSAILAFAQDVYNRVPLNQAFCQTFYRYLQSRRKLLYPLAMAHISLLQVMLQEQMIPLEDVDAILDSTLAGEQAEAVAALMQYKQSLTQVSEDSLDGLDDFGSLDVWEDLELSWDLPALEKTPEQLAREWGTKKNSDGTGLLLLYRGSDLELMVPAMVGELVITAVAPAACSPQRYGIKHETITHRRQIRTVTVEEGILRIGNHAFAGCDNLCQVTLPESIIEIDYEAFQGCAQLTGIVIPKSVQRIGRGAFAGCSSLVEIQIPAGTQVAEDAFAGCPGPICRI